MLNKNGERALVYIANVDAIEPITFLNADGQLEKASNIEKLITGGWNLVVQKGRFEVDQLFIYAECDTILPADVELFAFLEGKRVRTKKLKGVVSQGVAFTIPEMLDVALSTTADIQDSATINYLKNCEWELGDDWTAYVGATKYDEYSNNGKKGDGIKLPPTNAKGKFPTFVPKTDEERIQNLAKELKYHWQGKEVVITEKLDGSSITLYVKKEESGLVDANGEPLVGYQTGICSRNFDLKLNLDDHFTTTGRPYLAALLKYCVENDRSLALQGEILGPGIQGNPYKLTAHDIYFFNVYDIDNKVRLTNTQALYVFADLDIMNNSVPILGYDALDKPMEDMIAMADGLSKLNEKANREGIVVRALDGSFSFKVISNKWLLKEKE